MCKKAFNLRNSLNAHIKMVHENEKPFQCGLYAQKFGKNTILESHVATVHENKRPFKCEHILLFMSIGKLFNVKFVKRAMEHAVN
jgi:hypothetical protein